MADGRGKLFRPTNLELKAAKEEVASQPSAPAAAAELMMGSEPHSDAEKGDSQDQYAFSRGQEVRVVGLEVLPKLNGLKGIVDGWDELSRRFNLCMEDGRG